MFSIFHTGNADRDAKLSDRNKSIRLDLQTVLFFAVGNAQQHDFDIQFRRRGDPQTRDPLVEDAKVTNSCTAGESTCGGLQFVRDRIVGLVYHFSPSIQAVFGATMKQTDKPTREQIARFKKACTCVIEHPAGTELIRITKAKWRLVQAEHDRIGRPLTTKEVVLIIGKPLFQAARPRKVSQEQCFSLAISGAGLARDTCEPRRASRHGSSVRASKSG